MKEPSLAINDTAVSPIIGVVLMIGLAVILAGTVHIYVIELGEKSMHEPSPVAEFTVEVNDCNGDKYRIIHTSGETIPAHQLYLRSPDLSLSGSWAHPSGYSTSIANHNTVQAGNSASICVKDPEGVTLHVVWTADQSDQTVILKEISKK